LPVDPDLCGVPQPLRVLLPLPLQPLQGLESESMPS
jgi:hypothetical protein